MTRNILAIDFGGMSVKYFVFDCSNDQIKAKKVENSQNLMDLNKLINNVVNNYQNFKNSFPNLKGIAMSFNSPVIEQAQVRWGKIEGFWKFFNIKNLLTAKLSDLKNNEIIILNDAKAALFAEYKKGSGQGHQHLALLTYGTAIGGAVLINGESINGPYGLGAELSNPIMGYDGKDFASIKTWTEFGSMTKLENDYFALTNKRLTGEKIFQLYDQKNDLQAKEVVTKLIRAIAIHVFNCCYLYGVSIVIIGGGLSNRKTISQEIKTQVEVIKNHLHLQFPCQIANAKFSNNAGAYGAYLNYLERQN